MFVRELTAARDRDVCQDNDNIALVIRKEEMSTRKGNTAKRGQKYQNRAAYNPARYGQSRQTKQASAVGAGGLCARCKDKIEWKKKYDKYKPLTVPKKCVSCGEKTVKQAYHLLCRSCAEEKSVCAKCGHNEDIVESFASDKSQEIREAAEFRSGLKMMKERERRTLLREQANGTLESKIPVTTLSEDEEETQEQISTAIHV